MNWKVANKQLDAQWRIFLLFIVITLLVVRNDRMSRGLVSSMPNAGPQDVASEPADHLPPQSPETCREAVLALFCLAEIAGELLILMERRVEELMVSAGAIGPSRSSNRWARALRLSAQARFAQACSPPGQSAQKLDTS